MAEILIVVIVILLGSGLCSCSETALFSVPLIKAKQLAQSQSSSALTLYAIRQNMSRPIATIVILNNFFNIVGSLVIGGLVSHQFTDAKLGLFSASLTFLIILFGEIIPKTLGEKYATQIALVIAIPIQFLTIIFTPFVWLIEKITHPLTHQQTSPTTNEAEIRFLTTTGYKEGVIEGDEAEMIERVFQLNDLTAKEIMTPKTMMTYLFGDLTLENCQEQLIQAQHNRILVVNESLEKVFGVVFKDELLTALVQGKKLDLVKDFLYPVQGVSDEIQADKLLKQFQEEQDFFRVVLDEKERVIGVVTLQDIIEILTGKTDSH